MKSALALMFLVTSLTACQPAEPVAVSGAVFQPPLGATGVGAAYFTITSAKADRIVAVTSPQADSVEIHVSVTQDGRASMQRLETLELPAGKPVEFAPGGMHLMVFSPRQGEGEASFPIIIELQSGAKRTVVFENRHSGGGHHG